MMIITGSVIAVCGVSSYASSAGEPAVAGTEVSAVGADFSPLDGLGEMFRDIRKAIAAAPKKIETPVSTGSTYSDDCKQSSIALKPLTYLQSVILTDSDAEAATAAPSGAH